jgi:hypothetical protein
MHSQLSFFLMAVFISASQAVALTKAGPVPHFRLQVASFPDKGQAELFAVALVRVGETPVFDTVEIEGRGFWTRVFVGLFDTNDAARRHGAALVARGIIKEFLVKRTESIQALTRPRRVVSSEPRSCHTSGFGSTGDRGMTADMAGLIRPTPPGTAGRTDSPLRIGERFLKCPSDPLIATTACQPAALGFRQG